MPKTEIAGAISVPSLLTTLLVTAWILVANDASAANLEIVWQTNAHFELRSVAFSRDGLYLASGGEDGSAKVWNLSNRMAVAVIQTPAKVLSVAISPSASLLVTGGDDGAVRAWSVPDGGLIRASSQGELIVWSLDIAPDGDSIVVARSNGRVGSGRISDGGGGTEFSGHGQDVYFVKFSPDGTRLASASADGTAKIWRVADGVILHNLTGHSVLDLPDEDDWVYNVVYAVDFSPDGTLLVTGGADGTAQIWRVSDGTRVRVLDVGLRCTAAKFSTDGNTLYTIQSRWTFGSSDSAIQFWRVSDGRLLGSFENTAAQCLAVCPDGKYFAYGTVDEGTLVVARVPLWIEQVRQAGTGLILRWQGGSGLYQLQRAADVVTGPWQNVGGATTATSATNTITGTAFYRVQSLAELPP